MKSFFKRDALRLDNILQSGDEVQFPDVTLSWSESPPPASRRPAPRRVFTGPEVAAGALKAAIIGAAVGTVLAIGAIFVTEARGEELKPFTLWGAYSCVYDPNLDATICRQVPLDSDAAPGGAVEVLPPARTAPAPAVPREEAACGFESGCDGRLHNVVESMRPFIFGAFASASAF